MKQFTIEEKFTGYANITIEAETQEDKPEPLTLPVLGPTR